MSKVVSQLDVTDLTVFIEKKDAPILAELLGYCAHGAPPNQPLVLVVSSAIKSDQLAITVATWGKETN